MTLPSRESESHRFAETDDPLVHGAMCPAGHWTTGAVEPGYPCGTCGEPYAPMRWVPVSATQALRSRDDWLAELDQHPDHRIGAHAACIIRLLGEPETDLAGEEGGERA